MNALDTFLFNIFLFIIFWLLVGVFGFHKCSEDIRDQGAFFYETCSQEENPIKCCQTRMKAVKGENSESSLFMMGCLGQEEEGAAP